MQFLITVLRWIPIFKMHFFSFQLPTNWLNWNANLNQLIFAVLKHLNWKLDFFSICKDRIGLGCFSNPSQTTAHNFTKMRHVQISLNHHSSCFFLNKEIILKREKNRTMTHTEYGKNQKKRFFHSYSDSITVKRKLNSSINFHFFGSMRTHSGLLRWIFMTFWAETI